MKFIQEVLIVFLFMSIQTHARNVSELTYKLMGIKSHARSIPEPTYEFIDHADNKIIARRSDGISYILTYNSATNTYRGTKYLNRKINPALKGPETQSLSSYQAEILYHELLALSEIS